MIRFLVRHADGTVQHGRADETLSSLLTNPEKTIWIDIAFVPEQREQVEAFLKKHFNFHPLALEDALQQSHLARVDDWHDYVYLVLDALDLEINRTLELQELDFFLGRNYLVTLHEVPIRPLEVLWDQCRQTGERRFRAGADHLLYQLIDRIVADYMTVVDGLDEEVDELERLVFRAAEPGIVTRIFQLRRTLLKLRRLLSYLREALNRLARDDFAVIDPQERPYFRDVYDQTVRLYEITEGLRDMAVGAMDSYMMVTSNRLNEVMRTLTVVTVLFAPLTFLTGFFGMNFFGGTYEVEAPWPAWLLFFLCLVGLVFMPAAMFFWIARKGWLKSTLLEREEHLSTEAAE